MFLPYIKDYVNTFMGKSITTFQWKDHLFEYFKKAGDPEKINALNAVDWDVGIPLRFMYVTTELTSEFRHGFMERVSICQLSLSTIPPSRNRLTS